MTLEQLTSQLEARYRDWGHFWRNTLDETSGDRVIAHRIVQFIEEAAMRAPITGRPGLAVSEFVKLASFANFRFGLLIGLMMGIQAAPEPQLLLPMDAPPPQPCAACKGHGRICFECYQPKEDCECDDGFDPVECPACGGSGRA